MGTFLNRFRGISNNRYIDRMSRQMPERQKVNNPRLHPRQQGTIGEGIYEGIDDFNDFGIDNKNDLGTINGMYDDVWIPPAQKPESFHHFILENQYKDLERSIRGFKDVYDKDTQQWKTIRKSEHCFTDEEAEEILRTAQSHLATDIKLSFINKEVFGIMMMAIYAQIDDLFYAISEYRYGRYGNEDKQYQMKLQNRKIFLELWTRIQANYSRAIQGVENRYTHESVKGQESLQQSGQDMFQNKRYT